MISASPTHADAVRAFVAACLNLDDESLPLSPVPFTLGTPTTPANVIWADRDPLRRPNLFCMLREVSLVSVGPTETVDVPVDSGQPTERLDQHYFDQDEWTVAVHVVSRLDTDDPTHAASAGVILRRVRGRMESTLSDPMRAQGCAPRRRGQILPLSRIARNAQWETRAAVDLTFNVGSVIVQRSVGFIETVQGVGTLAGLPSGSGEPGLVPFDATDDNP